MGYGGIMRCANCGYGIYFYIGMFWHTDAHTRCNKEEPDGILYIQEAEEIK